MIWSIFVISLGLASARNIRDVTPEYLEALRSAGHDQEYARLLGVDVNIVRPSSEQRSEGPHLTFVSSLGDILLPEEQERQAINFEKYPGSRWPNGKIPYFISTTDFTPEQQQFIRDAIGDFNKKVSKVQLVPYDGESDYVHLLSGSGCWSYLGRISGYQPLSLQSNGCLSSGTIQHEFMHAAGFHHEHNRADRDQYVKVLWDNIPEAWQSQYQKVDESDFPTLLRYDYYSVMHYPIWAPGNSQHDAFKIPEDIDRNRLGQNVGVSENDIEKLNLLYK